MSRLCVTDVFTAIFRPKAGITNKQEKYRQDVHRRFLKFQIFSHAEALYYQLLIGNAFRAPVSYKKKDNFLRFSMLLLKIFYIYYTKMNDI